MPPRAVLPGLDHRVRVALPESVGDERISIQAYGVRELMSPILIDRPQGSGTWLVMAFHTPVQVWVEGAGMVDAPAGSLVVWRPHAVHRFGSTAGTWMHSWLHADGDLLRALLDQGTLPLERPIAGIPPRLLDRCLLLMHDEIRTHAAPDPRILRDHLHTWLCAVERAAAGGASAPAGILAARTAIELRYAERLSLADLAAIAGCSRQHLCAAFRRWFGVTPVDHLLRVRLQHAWLLLQDRRLGVAEAAAAVGFRDYRHFGRLFKRRFGHPPRG